MKCFVCDAGTMVRRVADMEGQIKRKKYTVSTMALVCDQCGHTAMEGEDMPEFMRKLADAYRHAGLVSAEVTK